MKMSMRRLKPIAIVTISGAFLLWVVMLGTGAKAAGKWTGCSLGAAAGYSLADTKTTLDVPGVNLASIEGFSASGLTGTITAGCDLQMDRFVVGLWADYNWMRDVDTKIGILGGAADVKTGIASSYAGGARAGILLNYDTLAYGLVGYSQAKFDDAVLSIGGTPVGSLSIGDMSGWMVGAGIEANLPVPNMRLDLRYSATFYDRKDMALIGPVSLGLEPTVHNVRVGVSYLFGFDGMPDAPKAAGYFVKP